MDAPDFQYSRNTDSEAANRCPADECYDAQHVMQPPAQEKTWRNQSAGREIRWECAAAWQFARSGVQAPSGDQRSLGQIGRAHVGTPVTNATIVCSLRLGKKNNT